jgi:hypothetical protein
LILGLGSSAIGTLVERTTRFTMLLPLPRMRGHGEAPSVKNGPALAGHGAQAVRDAIAASITTLPEQLRRSLTWDQGAEMAQHARLRLDSGLAIYFCDPHSPWQRATNENTNGLLRQDLPEGHRPLETKPRRARRRRGRAEQPTTQDAPLENPSRSPRRASTLRSTRQRCDDPLNLGNTCRSATPNGWPRPARSPRSVPAATATTLSSSLIAAGAGQAV